MFINFYFGIFLGKVEKFQKIFNILCFIRLFIFYVFFYFDLGYKWIYEEMDRRGKVIELKVGERLRRYSRVGEWMMEIKQRWLEIFVDFYCEV